MIAGRERANGASFCLALYFCMVASMTEGTSSTSGMGFRRAIRSLRRIMGSGMGFSAGEFGVTSVGVESNRRS